MTAASLEPILELSTHLPLLSTKSSNQGRALASQAIAACAFAGMGFIFAALSY